MIDADDLALLTSSFEAALIRTPGAGAADAALHELGWGELLDVAPLQGAAVTFGVLGSTGAAACLLDDVVANALGQAVGADACVVLPAPGRSDPAGSLLAGSRLAGSRMGGLAVIDGIVSARVDRADRIVVPIAFPDGAITIVEIDVRLLHTRLLDVGDAPGLDPGRPYRRVRAVEIALADATPVEPTGRWSDAVRNARLALAHQLIAVSRIMLELARQHALERKQFGRPIGSFQAVRHRLAETLVAIEAAAGVAAAAVDTGESGDPLLAAAAKSLAGRAARISATNAQQVLAGIGFTTDHPFHLSLKRTMVLDTLFGSARTIPVEIGRALVAQRTAPRLIQL